MSTPHDLRHTKSSSQPGYLTDFARQHSIGRYKPFLQVQQSLVPQREVECQAFIRDVQALHRRRGFSSNSTRIIDYLSCHVSGLVRQLTCMIASSKGQFCLRNTPIVRSLRQAVKLIVCLSVAEEEYADHVAG